MGGPLSVTVRPVLQGGDEKGRLKTCRVADDDIILNGNVNTPNFEDGYFVGGQDVGKNKLQDFTMELLVPREKPALKAMELPFE